MVELVDLISMLALKVCRELSHDDIFSSGTRYDTRTDSHRYPYEKSE